MNHATPFSAALKKFFGQFRPSVAFSRAPSTFTLGRFLECVLAALLTCLVAPSGGLVFPICAIILLFLRVRVAALLFDLFWTLFWPTLLSFAVVHPLFLRSRSGDLLSLLGSAATFMTMLVALFQARVRPYLDDEMWQRRAAQKGPGKIIQFVRKKEEADSRKPEDTHDGEWIH